MLLIMIITGYQNPLHPVVLAAESDGAVRSDVSPTVIKPLIYYFVSRYIYSKNCRKKVKIIRKQLPIILQHIDCYKAILQEHYWRDSQKT